MASWKRRFLRILSALSYLGDLLRFSVSSRLGMKADTDLAIDAYRGYGHSKQVYITGRVLQDRFINTTEEESLWRNFINTFKRFNSNEINGADLVISVAGNTFKVRTDVEGYFHLNAPLPHAIEPSESDWYPMVIQLKRTPWQEIGDLTVHGDLLIPQRPKFGIISDLDDTVIKTGVTSVLKLQMLYLTILKSARGRRAFHKVNAFFKALRNGGTQGIRNPFFYVSNSPWNLYDLLEEFLTINQLPKGPILLRDFGYKTAKHKYSQIRHILETYPDLPFILVGDSGEKDTETYITLAREFPNRILAIFIHDLRSKKRAQRIKKIILQNPDIKIFLFQRYRDAAQYAAELELLSMADFNRHFESET